MKKYISIVALSLLVFTACEEENENIYRGESAVSFGTTSFDVTVPEEGLVVEVPVNVTTVSTSERTLDITVDDSSVGSSADYTIGAATIPAGSYNGTVPVTFNFDPLVEGEANTLVLNLASSGSAVFSGTASINYLKEIVCNDYVVTIITDVFGSETTWQITDASGAVAASGGPYVDQAGGGTFVSEFFLPDGCYTFTIFDSYGDGQFDGTITGSFTIECSILTVATGGGQFGSSASVDFCVNQ